MIRLKKITKRGEEWFDGYIDFSIYQVCGYHFRKSTYSKGKASSLITPENIQIIEELIPLFNKKESLFSRVMRLISDHRGKEKEVDSSFLFKVYCNGFTIGFKDIDKKIKMAHKTLRMPSIENCSWGIKEYINELTDKDNLPTIETTRSSQFRDYLLDLGAQEGAKVREIIYMKEYREFTNKFNR